MKFGNLNNYSNEDISCSFLFRQIEFVSIFSHGIQIEIKHFEIKEFVDKIDTHTSFGDLFFHRFQNCLFPIHFFKNIIKILKIHFFLFFSKKIIITPKNKHTNNKKNF